MRRLPTLLAAALAVAALTAPHASATESCTALLPRNDIVDAGYCSDGGCTDICDVSFGTYCRSDVTAVGKACSPLNQEIL